MTGEVQVGNFIIFPDESGNLWIISKENDNKQIEIKYEDKQIEVIPRADNTFIPFAIPDCGEYNWVGVKTL
jgi:hypothetical protein